MQSKFRIKLSDAGPKVQHTRRTHFKSRNGCKACKQKRTKCDESKPACKKCRESASVCMYELDGNPPAMPRHGQSRHTYHSVRQATGGLRTDAYDLLLEDIRLRIGDALPRSYARVALQGLHQFRNQMVQSLGFARAPAIRTWLTSQAVWRHTFLMHTIIAVGHSHLRKQHGLAQEIADQHKISAAAHWQCAFTPYRERLLLIQNGGVQDTDEINAVLATALMTAVSAFMTDDECSDDLYFTNEEDVLLRALNPLTSMVGVWILLLTLPCVERVTIWQAMSKSARIEASMLSAGNTNIEDLPVAFVKLCGLAPGSSALTNKYYNLVIALTSVLATRAGPGKIAAFLGHTWLTSRSLFLGKDPIALLFLSWWLAGLAQVKTWWTAGRAAFHCRAIVAYLESLNLPHLAPFLEYPATLGEAEVDWIWQEQSR